MRRSVLVALLFAACGSPPAASCRSNDDCPLDRVCLAGACGTPSGVDAGAVAGDDASEPFHDSAPRDAWPPSTLEGESCADPILLVPEGADGVDPTAVWTGEIGAYRDDGYPDCTGPDVGAPDVFFEIERPAGESDIVITTSPPGVDLVMAVDGACDDGHLAWVCNDDRDRGAEDGADVSSALFLWHYRPSVNAHLYLIVDGGSATTRGDITVQVEVRPASSTDCSGPLDLSGGGAVLAFAPATDPSNQGDCASVVGGDVLFRIGTGLAPTGRVAVESSDFPVSLRLIDPTCGISSTCAPTMGDDSYHFTSVGPLTESGFAFVAVEGISGDGTADGTFQLDYDP